MRIGVREAIDTMEACTIMEAVINLRGEIISVVPIKTETCAPDGYSLKSVYYFFIFIKSSGDDEIWWNKLDSLS